MLPQLIIGKHKARYPIIQGGMGVGISLSSLASAVTNAGGIGVIATAGLGLIEADDTYGYEERSVVKLRKEIRRARQIAPSGPFGVNIMVALSNYEQMVRTSIEEGVDLIFSGAGIPMRLPEYAGESETALVPIVSSGRAAALLCKSWSHRYHRLPDAFVVEGPMAGGHLGFELKQLQNPEGLSLPELVCDVLTSIQPYVDKAGRAIPVVGGGGIFTGADIVNLLRAGASGVQMATRFVCTVECEASDAFKQAYLNANKEDITFIKSPVGMPGRAINNGFLKSVAEGMEMPMYCPYHCIKTCVPEESPYCIALALNNARSGNLDEGFAFAGQNAYRCNQVIPVSELIGELTTEASALLTKEPILR